MLLKTKRFLSNEQGQDLVEHSLLMAFLVLSSAALFAASGGGIKEIWGPDTPRLAAANLIAGS